MLKALELVGFKSFADRTRFEFPAGITVVVGPNGSGKSNIVDGIKWVLGEQSAKSLRGKEMSDVIFKGTGAGESGRKPLNSAEATIVLDNENGIFSIDADEIHVTRRVYRSGEGEYLINGEPCRLKDIRDLFRGTGVATDAYSLIEQGKVDQMLQASTKDRRAIFEEAAGISRFKAKKIETQRRLARVEQNLLRLSDIVEEVDRRFRSIKAQASKATRYQEANQRLKQLRTSLGCADWHRFATRLREIETNRQQVQEQLAQDSEALAQLEQQRQETEAESNRLAQQIAIVEAQLADHRERIATCESSAGHLQVRMNELAEEQRRLRQQLVNRQQQDHQLAQRLAEAQQRADAAELDYRAAADAVATLEKQQQQLSEKLEQLHTQTATQRDLQQQLTKELSVLGREIGVNSSRLEDNKKQAQRLDERVALLEMDCEQQQSELVELQHEQLRLERDAEQKDSALADARQELDETRSALSERQEALAELKSERSGASRRAEVIEELEQKLEGVHAGVRQLIEQSRIRRNVAASDVVGLVADLIQVEVQHAPLIDVALGEVAQHVVLEGETLFNQLVDGELQLAGRVGLIRLSEVPAGFTREATDLTQLPGVIGCAVEMVQAQAIYEPLVRHLLGTTWVVKTLRDALELREQTGRRVRFVTLTGQLVEPDGTVIAGPRTSAGGLVSRRSELRSLKAQIERLDRELQAEHLQVVELQQSVVSQEQLVQKMFAEHSELAALLSDHRLMASNLEQRLQSGKSQLHASQAELRELHQQIEASEEKLTEQQTRSARLETELEHLERELSEAGKAQQTFELERDQIAKQLTSSKVELAKAEQFLEGVQDQLQQDQQDHDRRDQERQALQHQLSQCQQRLTETRHQRLSATSELAILYLEKQQYTDQGRQAANAALRYRESRQAMLQTLESHRSQLRQLEQQLHQLELEAGKLELERESILVRLRDDYGIEVDHLELADDWSEGRSREEIEEEIQSLKRKINSMGAVNLEALNELSELEARYGALNAQYNDLVGAKESLTRIIDRINADSRRLFSETLEAIRQNFQVLYRRSFGGGKADLVLEEGVDILEAGIDIIATPPGKPEFSNSLLSGGEKALTAVALLLAIFQYRPSPFCVLDEVDAPFDEANIGRFIDVLTGFLDRTRFVIVTHSKKTMTAATTLYGVTMQESGVSKRVSVKFEDVSEDGHISQSAVKREQEDDQDAA